MLNDCDWEAVKEDIWVTVSLGEEVKLAVPLWLGLRVCEDDRDWLGVPDCDDVVLTESDKVVLGVPRTLRVLIWLGVSVGLTDGERLAGKLCEGDDV